MHERHVDAAAAPACVCGRGSTGSPTHHRHAQEPYFQPLPPPLLHHRYLCAWGNTTLVEVYLRGGFCRLKTISIPYCVPSGRSEFLFGQTATPKQINAGNLSKGTAAAATAESQPDAPCRCAWLHLLHCVRCPINATCTYTASTARKTLQSPWRPGGLQSVPCAGTNGAPASNTSPSRRPCMLPHLGAMAQAGCYCIHAATYTTHSSGSRR